MTKETKTPTNRQLSSMLGPALTFGLVLSLFFVFARIVSNEIVRAYFAAIELDIIFSYLQSFVNQTALIVLSIFAVVEIGLYFLKKLSTRLESAVWILRVAVLSLLLFLITGYELNMQRWFPPAMTTRAFMYDAGILLGCVFLGLYYLRFQKKQNMKTSATSYKKFAASLAALLVFVNGLSFFLKNQSEDGKPNVILLVIDALRSDHLGCYGYPRSTSPSIDAFAQESVIFTQCYSQSAHTKPSIASLFTSVYPSQHNIISGNQRDAEGNVFSPLLVPSLKTMAEYMKESGYNTLGLLEQGQLRSYMGFAQGFNYYNSYMILATFLNEEFLDWLPFNKHRKFFAYLHYQDVHAPYTPLPAYAEMFSLKKDNLVPIRGSAWQKAKDDWREFLIDFKDKKVEVTQADLDQLVNSYDAEIRALDDELGVFFQKLKDQGLYDNSIIIITADHGEAFLEHGKFDHGNGLYDEVLRIPLIIRFPKMEYKGVVEPPVQMVDLLPTILDYLKIPQSDDISGHSLMTHLAEDNGAGEYPVYSEWEEFVMIRKGDNKLIYDRKLERAELYNLKTDPLEQNDLSAQDLALVEDMKTELLNWSKEVEAKRIEQVGIKVDDKTVENLKSLGYIR
jgi:arylsulfatase A-like enzyme